MQIYADFSGYTDIAIGIALLLGFTFPQNFDSPYAAVSIQDFWRRWHMTLSRWLRDYLYIPLGGSRRGVAIDRNLLLTMLLGGLWRRGVDVRRLGPHPRHRALRRALLARAARDEAGGGFTWVDYFWRRLVTFHVVCFAWIFFRSETFGVAWDMITGLFTRWGQPSPLVTGPVLLDRRRDRLAVPPAASHARSSPSSHVSTSSPRPPCSRSRLMVTQALGPQDVALTITSSSDGRRERQGT